MAKRKQTDDTAPADDLETTPGLNSEDDAPAVTLGDAPAEAFIERTGEETNVNPSLATAPDLHLAQLEAGAIKRAEAERLSAGDDARPRVSEIKSDLPYWHVSANCSTPIEFPEALIQAENEQDAEAEFRRLNGLYGSIGGGLRIVAHVPQ
jgi:hypothetical protein